MCRAHKPWAAERPEGGRSAAADASRPDQSEDLSVTR